jgi:hypothetical protein
MPVRDLLTSLGVKGGDLPRVSSKALVVIRKKSMRKVWTSRTRRGGLGHLVEAMCVISDLVCNVMRVLNIRVIRERTLIGYRSLL